MKALYGFVLLALCCLSITVAVLGMREQATSPSPFTQAGDARNISSAVSGRFTGIYHDNLMEVDWFFPCDGTHPFQVEASRELSRNAETINQRFPSVSVRRNGVYLTALGTNEVSGERRSLDVRVILSMSPDRPADCRTPDRDHAMAIPPSLAYD
jgi:hypothetical protein